MLRKTNPPASRARWATGLALLAALAGCAPSSGGGAGAAEDLDPTGPAPAPAPEESGVAREEAAAGGVAGVHEMLDRADRVFEGHAVGVEETVGVFGSLGAMPATRVAFEVVRAWKGAAAGDEVVLTFLGGRASDGRVLGVSGIPTFREGDRDLLFVDSTDPTCPLVGWERGRIRMAADGPRTDAGTPLSFDLPAYLDQNVR